MVITKVVGSKELSAKRGLRAKDYIPEGQKFRIGVRCTVKKRPWEDWCLRTQNLNGDGSFPDPPEQAITAVRNEGPLKGRVMLAYPFAWWKRSELNAT